MRTTIGWTLLAMVLAGAPPSHAQRGESDLRIFGYFQTTFTYQIDSEGWETDNTFNLQQMNVFLQKDLGRNWTSFVNFEVVNTYSSDKLWGAFNLEEAWVRYRLDRRFNLKVGLQIPEFNHLNSINNRTPILPYVIRPLVYETSFSEIIATEDYVPNRAWVQAYGYLPYGDLKLDYAVYVGNSPNISSRDEAPTLVDRQTGVDSTDTFMFGGRIGVRTGELKVGFSSTYEKFDFPRFFADSLGAPVSSVQERPRIRLGADVLYRLGRLLVEAEYIKVMSDIELAELDFEREFYYVTVGYDVTDRLFAFTGYWDTHEFFIWRIRGEERGETGDIRVPNIGLSYRFSDRITFKTHHAYVDIKNDVFGEFRFNFLGAAVSVFF